jgi:hypothetical protein
MHKNETKADLHSDAGKSTLIKMLIELAQSRQTHSNDYPFPSPVPGVRGATTTTSADVHLYPDPDSYFHARPCLFADCEGLGAGEILPRALRREVLFGERRRFAISGGRIRSLKWAEMNPETRNQRGYIVSELYPRLLYTLSDVVVFTLRSLK